MESIIIQRVENGFLVNENDISRGLGHVGRMWVFSDSSSLASWIATWGVQVTSEDK